MRPTARPNRSTRPFEPKRPRGHARPRPPLAVALLLTLAAAAEAAPATATAPATAPSTDALDRLRAAETDPGARVAAARRLLDSDRLSERTWHALTRLAVGDERPGAARAIARAAARLESPPARLREPLLASLHHATGEWARAAAAAIGGYDSPEIVRRLAGWLASADAPARLRQGAALALGHHRSKRSARALIAALDPDPPDGVRDAVLEGLRTLTGIAGDRAIEGWRRWWRRHRDLPEPAWSRRLLENWARRGRRLAAKRRRLADRLVEAERRLYRKLDAAARGRRIARLLQGEVSALRRLGVRLAEQRLVDNEPIPDPVRSALVGQLHHGPAGLRRKAALLLRDLGHAPAADAVAELLASGAVEAPKVRRAYWRVLARMPRRAAVPVAIEALRDPEERAAAAEALAAAAREGLLAGRSHEVRRALLAGLGRNGGPLQPAVVRLLARVATETDWARIREWLDHEDGDVRAAAALAWIEAGRPLPPLVPLAFDERLGRRVLAAIRKRGHRGDTFLALIRRAQEPGADGREPWARALEALARRVPWPVVAEGCRSLGPESRSLRMRLLRAAWVGRLRAWWRAEGASGTGKIGRFAALAAREALVAAGLTPASVAWWRRAARTLWHRAAPGPATRASQPPATAES